MSGNKGGCGIRLDLHDTSICLMTCHLAAGHTNIDERNSDYNTIANGLTFQRGKTIEDHECANCRELHPNTMLIFATYVAL
jgi:hypothetical protein